MRRYIAKYWFFAGIALVIPVGLCFPVLGDFVKKWHILQAGIFLTFLFSGLKLETRMALKEIRNFKALSAALVSCFVLFPIVAVPLAKCVWSGADDRDLVVGVCILASAPVTIASGILLTQMAQGNVPLSIFICVATNAAAVFTAPMSLNLLLRLDAVVQLPVSRIMGRLFLVVLLPTIIGQLLRVKLKDVVARRRRGLSIFSQCIVLLIILKGLAGSTERISAMGLGIVTIFLFAGVLHAVILAMNLGISKLIRLNSASTSAFTIHTSQKTLTVSSLLWEGYFPGFTMGMIPVIVYHLTQLILDTAVAARFKAAAARDLSST